MLSKIIIFLFNLVKTA